MKLVTTMMIKRAAHWCRAIAFGMPFLFLPASSPLQAAACPNKVATVGTPVWHVADCIESIVDDIWDTSCIRTIIRTLPVTITALDGPGVYSIGVPLTWAGPGAAITITTAGVELDFHCLNLDIQPAAGVSAVGIDITSSGGQCVIRNGRISAVTNTGPAAATTMINISGGVSTSLIDIQNMRFVSDAQINTTIHTAISATSMRDITISNCEFFQSTFAINMAGCARFHIINCEFNRVFDGAINILAGTTNGLIENSSFMFCGGDINIDNSSSVEIDECYHISSGRIAGQSAVSLVSSGDITVRNCTVDSAGTRLGVGVGVVDAYNAAGSNQLTFINNTVNFCTGSGFSLDAGTISSQIIECTVNNASGNGISVAAIAGNMVVSCAVSNATLGAYPGPIPPLALIASGTAMVAAAANKWINISLP